MVLEQRLDLLGSMIIECRNLVDVQLESGHGEVVDVEVLELKGLPNLW